MWRMLVRTIMEQYFGETLSDNPSQMKDLALVAQSKLIEKISEKIDTLVDVVTLGKIEPIQPFQCSQSEANRIQSL